ncbi:interferon-inducible GTPase 5-like [Symsagittifera roscoffensis]|uniref:interferon-inducible GTPase 5-like n=1 Tax=Symsagittifera roscoffensis TaxID=84072 RepID=UPI00307BDC35
MAEAGHQSNKEVDSEREKFEIVKKLAESHGMGKALYDKMKEERDKWRKEVINIAVIGQARQGKSSLINAFMGKKVAKVSALGVTTTKNKKYPHPSNENIILWDLPGIDSVKHQREDYIDKIGIKETPYDFFLIVTRDIFSSDAKFAADLVQGEDKRFYIVRTHIDESIKAELEDNEEKCLDELDVRAEIRKKLKEEIGVHAFNAEKFRVYLVNCKKSLDFDFPKLQKDICEDSVSEIQQEALLLTIGGHGQELIKQKYALFQKRIYKVALASAAGGAVPIPGVSAAVDLLILIEEALTYFEGFGLSKESIASLEELNEVERGTIEKALKGQIMNKYPVLDFIRERAPSALSSMQSLKDAAVSIVKTSSGYLLKQLYTVAASEGVEKIVTWCVPILGSAMAAGISYAVTTYQLQCFLEQFKNMAEFANSYLSSASRHRLEAFEARDE